MIKIIKKKNYYYFFKNNKPLTTTSSNKIKVKGEKEARELSKYLLLCLNSKSKVKNFFLQILFFSFDLNKKKKLDIIENIVSFLNTDLVCYRAEKNSELEKTQTRLWNPLIAFVEKKYKFIFKVTNSIIPVKQIEANKGKLLRILRKLNNHELTSFYFITNFSNSNIITLNFLSNNINSKNAWEVLSLEEAYNLVKWGQDKEAKDNLLDKQKHFNEIIKFSQLLKN